MYMEAQSVTFWNRQFSTIFFADSHKLFLVQQLLLYFKNYLFIYFWLCWVFVAARPFSVVVESGDYPLVAVLRLSTAVLSCCEPQALGAWVSVVVACRLTSCGFSATQHRLNISGTQVQLLRNTWDLPGSRIVPVSPTLAGGFFTTGPPEKPSSPNVIAEKNPMVWMFQSV